ncbi:MAG: tRNA (adenosine(37)-N6)-dimethylallyltransferase MiaA [Actinobacteria bacterium]|nr:tRNA (adenosine(37)-N6)-dimethylallyltransferase MiaA [Actinomycetota bacterium]
MARERGAEIVSVDSMLVYRGMDVGTAKPSAADRAGVPHHLLDLADPAETFSVARYQRRAAEVVRDAEARRANLLFVGGSGLYWRAVVDGLSFPGTDPDVRRELEAEAVAVGAGALHARLAGEDPEAAARIEPGNVRRTVRALEVARLTGRPFSSFASSWDTYPDRGVRAAGIRVPREILFARIERRVRDMIDAGLVEEVRGLVGRGLASTLTARQAIGYAEVIEHLEGRATIEEVVARTVRRTKALARRQMAWFQRDPRIRWFDTPSAVDALDDLRELYAA